MNEGTDLLLERVLSAERARMAGVDGARAAQAMVVPETVAGRRVPY